MASPLRIQAYAVMMLVTLCSGYAISSRSRCFYGKIHKLFTANCSEQDLQKVPQDLKNSTEVLDLSDNKIRILSNSSFIYYTSLQILYLSDNRILYIEEGTFLPLTELKTLDLSSNSLRKVPYVLPSSLVKLYLAANPIEEVSFSNANSLQYLSLADNHFETLPTLGLMPSLVQLNLSETKIYPRLTPDFLATMCRLQLLHLPNNLLASQEESCDCLRLAAWIQERHIKVDHLNCKPLETENRLQCNTTVPPQTMELYAACLDEWDDMNMPYLALFLGSACLLTIILIAFLIWLRRRRSRTSRTPEKAIKDPEMKEPSLLTS